MTARRATTPLRHSDPRSKVEPYDPADSYDPLAGVEAARAKVDSLRRAVLARRAGAASLAVAEWELAKALDRWGDDEPPTAA